MAYRTYGSPLLDCVQSLVRERPASLQIQELAKEIGVTPVWLGGFANGRYPNPSAIVIERLYVRLTGKQLVDHV
jgi:hypothetical protein